jgi:tight adherence protein B
MTTAWLLLGVGLACVGGDGDERRRVDGLARAGRLRRGSASSVGLSRVSAGGGAGEARTLARTAATIVLPVAAAVVVSVVAGILVGAAVGVLAGTTAVLARDVRRHRAQLARRSSLLSAVRLMVAELEAGTRPTDALRAAADVCPEYTAEFASAASGAAWAGGTVVTTSPELAAIGHAFTVATSTGAPLAAVLDRVADDIEHSRSRVLRLSALTAGPRASAAMLAALPALGLLLGASIGAHPLRVLFASSGGQLLCCAGAVLDALGVLWTRRILARAGAA